MTHRVYRDWLGGENAERLLAYAIGAQARFTPTKVRFPDETEGRVEERERRSLVLRDLGSFAEALSTKARDIQGDVEKTFGMSHVPLTDVEVELVAHGEGGFYRPHIDTFTAVSARQGAHRRLSLVYYFHRLPRRFTGGHLHLLGIGSASSATVDPAHDSLVAFPSFLPHEVEKVSCAGGDFADSRFAANIWLYG